MENLLERLKWALIEHRNDDAGIAAAAILREIQSTHCIINPEEVTEEMLEACFGALPEHYDPPDMSRRPWHALKAKRRYTAMVKAAKKIAVD